MKIRMITFHTPKNYGALLQAFSLMKYMEEFSNDVKIIDYDTENLRKMYPILPKPQNLKSLIRTFLMLPYYLKKIKKYEKFNEFVKKSLNLTQKFDSINKLSKYNWEKCLFITGSDQVFNPNRILEERQVFYLNFVPKTSKKISYAASFGKNEIPSDKREEISRYLKSFDAISVREEYGVNLVKGLLDREVTHVLDPVFLNDDNFWRKNSFPYKKHLKNYLLYYRLLSDKKSDEFARNLAKEKGLNFIVLTDNFFRGRADFVLRDVGPKEFLDLMAKADFVVTNAFHGVAFSIILKKQFIFSDVSELTNGRGFTLLKDLNIEKIAYIKTYNLNENICYKEVDKYLIPKINKSKEYIKSNLEKFE